MFRSLYYTTHSRTIKTVYTNLILYLFYVYFITISSYWDSETFFLFEFCFSKTGGWSLLMSSLLPSLLSVASLYTFNVITFAYYETTKLIYCPSFHPAYVWPSNPVLVIHTAYVWPSNPILLIQTAYVWPVPAVMWIEREVGYTSVLSSRIYIFYRWFSLDYIIYYIHIIIYII